MPTMEVWKCFFFAKQREKTKREQILTCYFPFFFESLVVEEQYDNYALKTQRKKMISILSK